MKKLVVWTGLLALVLGLVWKRRYDTAREMSDYMQIEHLWFTDIESMRGMVNYYSRSESRRERRLAGNLAKALRWIEWTPQFEKHAPKSLVATRATWWL